MSFDLRTNQIFSSIDVQFHENVFPFKLIDCSTSEHEKYFMNFFPFGNSNMGHSYKEIVSDKVGDTSISIEKNRLKTNDDGTLKLLNQALFLFVTHMSLILMIV